MGDTQEIIRAAADILTKRYGGEQQLVDVERLDGSGLADVFRARVVNNPFFQHRSVVVKHSPPRVTSWRMRHFCARRWRTSSRRR